MAPGIAGALKVITSSAFHRGTRDDDFIDRLNHMVMHGLLLFLALFTATKQYVGTPIYCWLPANYVEKFQRRFANYYCWVHTMYNVPFDEAIPVAEDKRYYNDVSYYRWASMMFILLAVFFRVPQLLWKELKKFSGANMDKLIGMTAETTLMDQDKRDKHLGYVAEFIHRWVTTRKMIDRNGRFHFLQKSVANFVICYGKRSGHNLVFTYLLIKVLYLLNSIGQFFLVSRFLKTNYWTYGIDAVTSYAQHGQWEDEDVFPRVALCDLKIRALGQVYMYTLQCVLGLNLFLEKFFFILWFCFLFMLIANAVSLAVWASRLLQESKTIEFMSAYARQLFPVQSDCEDERKHFIAMAKKYLQGDGVFVIRMIAENSNHLLTIDLIRQIWLRYKLYLEGESKQKIDFSQLNGDLQKTESLNSDTRKRYIHKSQIHQENFQKSQMLKESFQKSQMHKDDFQKAGLNKDKLNEEDWQEDEFDNESSLEENVNEMTLTNKGESKIDDVDS